MYGIESNPEVNVTVSIIFPHESLKEYSKYAESADEIALISNGVQPK